VRLAIWFRTSPWKTALARDATPDLTALGLE
jgi:hypothetical protein